MKLKSHTKLFIIIFSVLGLAILMSATVPSFNKAKFISLVDIEIGDTDSQEEEDAKDCDDKNDFVDKFISIESSRDDMMNHKLSFFNRCVRNVHIDIITPPPDCC